MKRKLFILCFWIVVLSLFFFLSSDALAQPQGNGNLRVVIQPQEAVGAGAQWKVSLEYYRGPSIRGPGDMHMRSIDPQHPYPWHSSGEIVPFSPNWTRIIVFKEIPGWVTPGYETVTVVSGETTTITKTYIRSCSLTVTIQPQEAVAAGAKWSVDSSPWKDSGATIYNLRPGSHQVQFKSLNDSQWITPDSVQANIVAGETSRQTGTYIAKGSLTVTIQPQEAVAAGAQWSATRGADALSWQNSGGTVSNLRMGIWEVRFKSLNDARWIIPERMNVNITTAGQAAQATATYQRAPGSLSVVILPPELRQAGAQWRVVKGPKAGAWQNSEAVLSVPEGQHQLEFKEVAGWVRPATQDMNIASLQNIQLRGEYRRETGGIQVNIQPEGAVRSGARWRFAGPYIWYNSGETATGITTGQRELEFHDAGASWERPSNQTVNIAGGQTASVTVTYQPASGTLNVTIEPNEAIRAGAQWKVGDRPWKRSGESERLPVGQHRIEVSPSQGWALSAPGPVNITAGQQTRATVTLRRGEAPLTAGQLRVKIEPQEAVAAGARWRADGGPWQDSNVSVPGLPAGQHRVEYKTIDKWTAPLPETVNVPAGGSAFATGRYNRR